MTIDEHCRHAEEYFDLLCAIPPALKWRGASQLTPTMALDLVKQYAADFSANAPTHLKKIYERAFTCITTAMLYEHVSDHPCLKAIFHDFLLGLSFSLDRPHLLAPISRAIELTLAHVKQSPETVHHFTPRTKERFNQALRALSRLDIKGQVKTPVQHQRNAIRFISYWEHELKKCHVIYKAKNPQQSASTYYRQAGGGPAEFFNRSAYNQERLQTLVNEFRQSPLRRSTLRASPHFSLR